ncbi:MAG: 2-amino-4-hydroxy-6-hydroxymethyldihydropteridine diphosphokinase [Alphaproteobacteria bacterium]|nr:MAG: 2-amino-4-hydroxy-6-hydroxymethyldihydropteridine diphosphokinase [Alphaproteobacteria bacterium]
MILIGLGANLNGIYGAPEQCLKACSDLLAGAGIYIVKSSNIWKSAPVPVSDQPWYCNAVCAVETVLSPPQLLCALATIENDTGRERHEANAARVLDLDILSYNDEIINEAHLTVPHPALHERAFVLYPMQEIAPHWVHPRLDKSVDEMIVNMPKGQEIQCIENSQLLSTYMDKQGAS